MAHRNDTHAIVAKHTNGGCLNFDTEPWARASRSDGHQIAGK